MVIRVTALVVPASPVAARETADAVRARLQPETTELNQRETAQGRAGFAQWLGQHLQVLHRLSTQAGTTPDGVLPQGLHLHTGHLDYFTTDAARERAQQWSEATVLEEARIAIVSSAGASDPAFEAEVARAIRSFLAAHLGSNLSVLDHPIVVTADWAATSHDAGQAAGRWTRWHALGAGNLSFRTADDGQALFPSDVRYSRDVEDLTDLLRPLSPRGLLGALREQRRERAAHKRDPFANWDRQDRLQQRPLRQVVDTLLGKRFALDAPPTRQTREQILAVRDPAIPTSTCQLLSDVTGRRVSLPDGGTLEPNLLLGNDQPWMVPLSTPTVDAVVALAREHLLPGSTQCVVLQPDVLDLLASGPRSDDAKLTGGSESAAALLAAADQYGSSTFAIIKQLAAKLDWAFDVPQTWGPEVECPDSWGIVVEASRHAELPPHLLASAISEMQVALQWPSSAVRRRPDLSTTCVTFIGQAAETYPDAWKRELASRLGATVDVRHARGKVSIEPDPRFNPRLRPAPASPPVGQAGSDPATTWQVPDDLGGLLPSVLQLDGGWLAPAADLRTLPARSYSLTGNGLASANERALALALADVPLSTDPRTIGLVLGLLAEHGFAFERERHAADGDVAIQVHGPALPFHVLQTVADVTGHRVQPDAGEILHPNLVLGNVDGWTVPFDDTEQIERLAAQYLNRGSGQAVVLRADAYRRLADDTPAILKGRDLVIDVRATVAALANRLGRPVIAHPPERRGETERSSQHLHDVHDDPLTRLPAHWSRPDLPIIYPADWGLVIPTTRLPDAATLGDLIDADVNLVNEIAMRNFLYNQQNEERLRGWDPDFVLTEPEVVSLERITFWGPADAAVLDCAAQLADRMGIPVVMRGPVGERTIAPSRSTGG